MMKRLLSEATQKVRGKLDAKAIESILIGYDQSSKEIININEESDTERGIASKIKYIVLPRRSSRSNKRKSLDRLGYLANENKNDSENYKALSRCDKNKWVEEERKSHNNHTWDLVKLPKGKKPIGCKWTFKRKFDQDGNIMQ
ncbi:hypothetical protein NPIL_475841 [Nephila pilipes]|uniref:Reverse transcriptase n=1 Tax=Nephila pilipes TaxID=299642 RepID=A0A8X6PLA7_NEPPI|nr:hypothetical protein NPIL_475841 [Nephila pilipes]